MKKWSVREPEEAASSALARETGLNRLVTDVLVGRGITNRSEADEFFNSFDISDPLLIEDMGEACAIIREALEDGKKIAVYGDYDCDGVTSTVMLFNYLTALGGEVIRYIPTRDEGYGLNIAAVDRLIEQGAELFITVDNGISAVAETDYIKSKGKRIIITDHHQPPQRIPEADAIINPNRTDDFSPYKKLAGCGVVLKLIMALEEDKESVIEQYGDLAAIGTVGDIVPLDGENRHIVERGLRTMECTENIGLIKLLANSGVSSDDEITSTVLAFSICPRINAAGRFATAELAAELLTTENEELAAVKAAELTALNTQRQQTEKEIMAQVETAIAADPSILNKRCIIVSGEGWHHGVVGIVSARLLSKYGKPNMVISTDGDDARGSARSIEGFSMFRILEKCSSLLTRFGGHSKAGGFSIKTADIPDFIRMVDQVSADKYPVMPVDSLLADKALKSPDFDIGAVEQLSILNPFGEANPIPLFLMRNCRIVSKKPLKNGKYVSFEVVFDGAQKRCLCFGISYDRFWYDKNDIVDILVNLEINEYNDRKSITIKVKEIRLSSINQEKFFAAKSAFQRLMLGEAVDGRLLKRIIPEKNEIKQIYDLLRRYDSLDAITQSAYAIGINYCMTMVTLEILAEFKLVSIDYPGERATLTPSPAKADLTKSRFAAMLREQIEKQTQ